MKKVPESLDLILASPACLPDCEHSDSFKLHFLTYRVGIVFPAFQCQKNLLIINSSFQSLKSCKYTLQRDFCCCLLLRLVFSVLPSLVQTFFYLLVSSLNIGRRRALNFQSTVIVQSDRVHVEVSFIHHLTLFNPSPLLGNK